MTDTKSSIMQRLKAETSDLHSHAESRALQREIASGEVDRDLFAAYLGQLFVVHRALETALEGNRDTHPAVASVATAERMRVSDLDRDLTFHGVKQDCLGGSEAANRFAAGASHSSGDDSRARRPARLEAADRRPCVFGDSVWCDRRPNCSV